ncbi:MAG: hypothetical protein M1473_12535 [Firmicutes bacterium]|nr:hypothetical protein [Bacillota bacterium]
MLNQSNAWPAAAAVVLAVLFPIYWLSFAWSLEGSFEAMLIADVSTLDVWDLLFVVLGALEVAVYLFLAREFKQRLNGTTPAILLSLMAMMVVIFHASVLADVAYALGIVTSSLATLASALVVFSLIILFLYAVLGSILAVSLFLRFSDLPTTLKIFSIGLLIACLLQITVIFAPLNVLLFPALMLVLALHFMRNPDHIDVV